MPLPTGAATSARNPPDHRNARDWRVLLATAAASGAAGLSVNQLHTDFGRPGTVIAIAVAALTGSVVFLRGLHPEAALRRFARWALFAVTVAGIGMAAWTTGGWSAGGLIAASLATMTAVLLPTDRIVATTVLAAASAAGIGVVALSSAMASVFRADGALAPLIGLCLGAAGLLAAAGYLRDSPLPLGLSGIAAGAGSIIGAVVYIQQGISPVAALTGFAIGTAACAVGIGFMRGWRPLTGIMAMGAGAAIIWGGTHAVSSARHLRVLDELAYLGIGAAAIGIGLGHLSRSRRLTFLTGVIAASATLCAGFAYFLTGRHLGGVTGIGVGLAVLGATLALSSVDTTLRTWWTAVRQPPPPG
ncbi:hypothetical protein AB0I28_38345 [Phytomonospora sp. NPDC050363]|uniref:hypothetical protein n=1 Tax=Phytomonospora sp. NPDC050363 TaxID=3155642 RepID=UPI0033EAA4C9